MAAAENEWLKQQFAAGFQKNFGAYQEKRIALYGIGENATNVLTCVDGFSFVAVAARDHFGERICGREIVPLAEAVAQSDVMIIAATPKSTLEVFQRIQPHLPDGYPVLNLYGHLLTQTLDTEHPYWSQTLDGLKRAIDAHDVISFDVFDTLLMRKVLRPEDVFALEEAELREAGEDVPFAAWRLAADVDQQRQGHIPTFDEIYAFLQEQHGFSAEQITRWKQREWELENAILVPRDDVVEAYQYAKAQGKTVCVTSDMYFPKQDMERLLAAKGVPLPDVCFVSCDFQSAKGDGGLFRPLLDFAAGRSVLHVGDNEIADEAAPSQLGIDVYPVKKAAEVLALSSCGHVLESAGTLEDRTVLGTVLAHVFNSPFCLAASKGKVVLDTIDRMTWLCFLPITMKYLQYIVQTVQGQEDAIVLFVSRDGYFLQKVYASLEQTLGLPPSVYFYTSRQACYGVMITDERELRRMMDVLPPDGPSDLRYVLEKMYGVPFSEELSLPIKEAVARWGMEGIQERVLQKKDEIFKTQAVRRAAYLRYMEGLHLERYQQIYCVDLLTRGTVAGALRNILKRPVHLIALGGYDAQTFLPPCGERHLCLGMLYTLSPICIWYVLLELLYASREQQVEGFTPQGKPTFVEGTEYSVRLLGQAQAALEAGMEALPAWRWLRGTLAKDYCIAMINLLDASYTEVSPPLMKEFLFTDITSHEAEKAYNILEHTRAGYVGA